MGLGDNIMATGMAKGASKRGRRIAFGDGKHIVWDQHSEQIFRGNPNIAHPSTERSLTNEWVAFYRGNRIYNRREDDKWIWNYDFRAPPGELFLSRGEKNFADRCGKHYIVIEPNVPNFKSVAPNKQWPVDRYVEVSRRLKAQGFEVVQFSYNRSPFRIDSIRQIQTGDFRHAVAALSRASLYIGPEGGLHHASAALSKAAVVLFGGFIPPQVTGYETHTNLTGGAEACGSLKPCEHCRKAMQKISVEEVVGAALSHLKKEAA